jgi:hypothetical protein
MWASVWRVLKRHRTKFLGGFQVASGAVVTQLPQFQATLKPVHYGLIMMGLGTTTAIMGYVNSLMEGSPMTPEPPIPPP